MLYACDFYLPSTCFGGDNMKYYDSFDNLPGKKGYGIVINKDYKSKTELIEICKNISWENKSFLSTNSAYNLRTSIIIKEIDSKIKELPNSEIKKTKKVKIIKKTKKVIKKVKIIKK